MHTVFVIALVAILGAFAASWLVRRFHPSGGDALALLAGLVGRLAVVLAMAYSAIQAFHRGGWLFAAAALFVLIGIGAVFTSAVSVGALWLLITRRGGE